MRPDKAPMTPHTPITSAASRPGDELTSLQVPMPHRLVGQVMCRDVVAVGPETSLKRAAKCLAEHKISGMPVVDSEDRVVGVLSLSDLAAWQAARSHSKDPFWRRVARGLRGVRRPLSRVRSQAGTAGGLMSAPAIVLEPRQNVVEAARMMARHRVDRLPVMDEECRLIGIVTRTDLLSLFLRPDSAIRAEIESEVLAGALALPPGQAAATVHDGVVTLTGTVSRRSDIPIVERLTSRVDGVVATVDRLDFEEDDTFYLPVDYYRGDTAEDWRGVADTRPR